MVVDDCPLCLAEMIQESLHDVYAPASAGPFLCDNCEYFDGTDQCNNDDLIKYRVKRGDPQPSVVEPKACCDYFEKKS